MPIRPRRPIRKMRGGAQSHLIEGEDGEHYVVKFSNNPQHRRILINEWLASAFLSYLQVYVPETALIDLTGDFLECHPDLYMSLGSRRVVPEAGLHFGSRVAVHPDRVAIYDFLPDSLLYKVENRTDFLGTLVFDKWVGNADSRQSIFFRAKAKAWTPLKSDTPARAGFWCQMIDHGFAFNGPHWSFQDSPIQGLYFRTSVYDDVRSLDSFQPWLDRIRDFPAEVIDEAWKQIPPAWFDSDRDELERLLESLLKRRSRVEQLLLDVRRGRSGVFQNWK